jgi:hypothetical protein
MIEQYLIKFSRYCFKKKYKEIKFSVDINLDSISGWISIEKGNINSRNVYAILTRHGVQIAAQKCYLQRDDVRIADLHKDGNCGFMFSKKILSLIEGNLYKVSFISDFILIGSSEIFFGEPKVVANLFHSYEFLPRNDFKLLEYSHDELMRTSNSDIEFIKKIVIRLRRGKRSHCSRFVFKGERYEYQIKDWIFFRTFVIANVQLIIKNFHPRNIWSIVDTFADYGGNGEELAALSLSNILFQERFAQTLNCIYDFIKKDEIIFDHQLPYWAGFTNRLVRDDAYDIFITRNLELLNDYPIIKIFFIYFLLRMLDEKKSILEENISHSIYFRDMGDFYKKYLDSFFLDPSFQNQKKRESEKYFNTLNKKLHFFNLYLKKLG